MTLTLVTSIPVPVNSAADRNRVEYLKACASSWTRAGVRLISVNTEAEILRAGDSFGAVRFVPAQQDAASEFGRPLIYLSDLASVGMASGAEAFGIVNADIKFNGNADVAAEIERLALTRFIYANRLDVSAPTPDVSIAPSSYVYGFDVFAFPTALAAQIDWSGFAMGVPWWDYWIPTHAHILGHALIKCDSTLFQHESHAQAWNYDLWRKGLRLITHRLLRSADDRVKAGAPDDVWNSLARYFIQSCDPDHLVAYNLDGEVSEKLSVALGVFLVHEIERRSTVAGPATPWRGADNQAVP